jgi:hypothetical protein
MMFGHIYYSTNKLSSLITFNLIMPTKQQVLSLYRLYFTLTRPSNDRSLKLYIRRRAKEDFHALTSVPEEAAVIEF